MFVDSSALVAMLSSENGAEQLAGRLSHASSPLTSPIAIFETVLALRRKYEAPLSDALHDTLGFLVQARVQVEEIRSDSHLLAIAAHERYGKGRGHPAQLNMGDCFSYAMAKAHGVPLLYTGEDFRRTDLA